MLLSSELILWLLKPSRGQFLEEQEQLRLRNDSILFQIKSPHILPGLLRIEPPGLIKLPIELIQEGMQLVDIQSAVPVRIVEIEYLVDEHPENTVVQT